jgi:amidophosphoribosyltransferase
MAHALGADSLRYLPVPAIARAVSVVSDGLCQACITGDYPTDAGRKLYQLALAKARNGQDKGGGRTYDVSCADLAADPVLAASGVRE